MKSSAGITAAIISLALSCLSSFAQLPKEIKELPLPQVPSTLTQPVDRADFIISHFWDGLDFECNSDSLDEASLEQNFVNYINLFTHSHRENLPQSINKLLADSENNPTLAKQLYAFADKYFATKDSPFRNEGFYIIFLENAAKSRALGEAGRERAKYRLDAAMKNRPGNPIADFKFQTREGALTSISSLPSASKTLLIFYDPDCGHCSETIEEIKRLPLDSIQVVAIDPQEDKMLWDATKSGLPDNWTVGFAIDPIQDDETYIFEEMPTMFVLDNENKIVLKDATILELKEIIQ